MARVSNDSNVFVILSYDEAAHLLNLVSDNARAWNATLREGLTRVVPPTDAYNARLELQQGPGARAVPANLERT